LFLFVRCRGLGSSNEAKFEGKKRFLHIAFQGRFKRDVKASDFWSGHEWFSVSDLVPTRCVTLLLLCYRIKGDHEVVGAVAGAGSSMSCPSAAGVMT
jgi:hypothetical protein